MASNDTNRSCISQDVRFLGEVWLWVELACSNGSIDESLLRDLLLRNLETELGCLIESWNSNE